MEEKVVNISHKLILDNRKEASVTGVKDVISFDEKENLIQRGVGGFVQKDCIDSRLLEEIDFARIRNACINKSKKIIEELEHKLDDRKLIDQAKGVLIDQGFSEKEAYQLMRKASMDQRVPLHKIAQAVLLHKKISEEGN